ncbi:MAG: hypothetical protein PHR35_00460 [Kiritimatiellae bacterium]|nr:hypothetical protein [Kiritimatiellia bacterium]
MGKKTAGYALSNWSSWSFLDADIRLTGDAESLPSPTHSGELVHAGIREATPSRIVAEAFWRDAAGGLLKARFIGWRGNLDRFGLNLEYQPPVNRQVERLTYVFSCHPFDYSARGQWWRERWLDAAGRRLPLDGATHSFTTNDSLRFTLFNRHGQNTAGVVLAPARETTENVILEGEKGGSESSSVKIEIRPPDASTRVVAVLGDWVDEAYVLAIDRFLSQRQEVEAELQSVLSLRLPPPALPEFRLPCFPESDERSTRLKSAKESFDLARSKWEERQDNRSLLQLYQAKSNFESLYRVIQGDLIEDIVSENDIATLHSRNGSRLAGIARSIRLCEDRGNSVQ